MGFPSRFNFCGLHQVELSCNNSEFMQQDGKEKRIAKLSCVTNMTGLLLAFFSHEVHLTLMCSGLLHKYLFKRR